MIGQHEQRRCVELKGRMTCVSLEGDFWEGLEHIALQCRITLGRLVSYVGGDADKDEVSALLRVFVLTYYQEGGASLPGLGTTNSIGSVVLSSLSEKRSFH